MGNNNFLVDILILIIVLGIMSSFNLRTADAWNDGVCPDCEVRYELKYAINTMNYYECFECGQTVKRIVTIFDRWQII